eukprot:2144784-Amphidinium_carterae.1
MLSPSPLDQHILAAHSSLACQGAEEVCGLPVWQSVPVGKLIASRAKLLPSTLEGECSGPHSTSGG